MAPNSEEKRGDWTTGEKASIMWSIIDAHPIDWKTTIVPKGRTRNAVTKMLGRERAKVAAEIAAYKAENGITTTTTTTTTNTNGAPGTPKTPRTRGAGKGTPAKFGKKLSGSDVEDTPSKRAPGSGKRKLGVTARAIEEEEEDYDGGQGEDAEDGPAGKKIKVDIKAERDDFDDDDDFGDFGTIPLAA